MPVYITAPIPELGKIIEAIKVITDPHQFGIHLGVPAHELDKFEKNYPTNVDRQMTEVIKYWRNNADDCSWRTLANAVERMGAHGNLVKKLREQHSESTGQNEVMKLKPVITKPEEKTAVKARY